MPLFCLVLSLSLCTLASAVEAHADAIETLLKSDPAVLTVEDVLAKLPPSFLSNPVLMYRSLSLQGASFSHPRVIAFDQSGSYGQDDGKSDRLFLAFNGNAAQENYQSLEMIQFRAKERRFTFSEIEFAPKQRPHYVASPAECVACHGSPGHPNWHSYADWPGAYPSSDGFEQGNAFETQSYETFRQGNGKKGRYQFLRLFAAGSISASTQVPSRMLSDVLQSLSDVTIPFHISQSRNYHAYRHVTMAALYECPHLETFIPADLRAKFARTFADAYDQTRDEEKRSFAARVADLNQLIGKVRSVDPEGLANFSLSDTQMIGGLRYVMEREGSSIAPWFYTLDQTEWAVPRSRFRWVGYALAEQDPTLANDCSTLENDSLQALNALMANDAKAFRR